MATPKPNVLITGTPGTGKTTTAEQAAARLGFRVVNVGELVRVHECHEGRDEVRDACAMPCRAVP
jgi:adenylate kinase